MPEPTLMHSMRGVQAIRLGSSATGFLAFLVVVPWFMGRPFLLLEPDVLASILTFLVTAVLIRVVDHSTGGPSFFRYDQASSVLITLLGFAVLNLIRGRTLEELYPSGNYFPGSEVFRQLGEILQARGIHAIAVGLAVVAGLCLSISVTKLWNGLARKSGDQMKRLERFHRMGSIVAFAFSAGFFSVYMSLTLYPYGQRSFTDFSIITLVCIGVGFCSNEVLRGLKEKRIPRVFLSDDQTLLDIGVQLHPATFRVELPRLSSTGSTPVHSTSSRT